MTNPTKCVVLNCFRDKHNPIKVQCDHSDISHYTILVIFFYSRYLHLFLRRAIVFTIIPKHNAYDAINVLYAKHTFHKSIHVILSKHFSDKSHQRDC